MAKDSKAQNFDTLTAADVADLLFVSEKTVRNWMNKNDLPSIDSGRGRILSWRTTLEWYISYRQKEAGKLGSQTGKRSNSRDAEPDEPMASALRRRAVAEADLKELELAVERGKVVATRDVERSVAKVATSLKQAILALPSRLATRLYGVRDKNAIRTILDAEARELCVKLAAIGQESAPDREVADGV